MSAPTTKALDATKKTVANSVRRIPGRLPGMIELSRVIFFIAPIRNRNRTRGATCPLTFTYGLLQPRGRKGPRLAGSAKGGYCGICERNDSRYSVAAKTISEMRSDGLLKSVLAFSTRTRATYSVSVMLVAFLNSLQK